MSARTRTRSSSLRECKNGRLILTQAKAEITPVTLVVDTGAQISIGNEALLRKLSKGSVKRTGMVELQSVTGEMLQGEYTIVRELTVGGITLKKLPIIFTDSHAFKRLGLNDRPALLLGMNALRSFDRVSIDFYRKKLKVVLPETGALARSNRHRSPLSPSTGGEPSLPYLIPLCFAPAELAQSIVIRGSPS